MEDIYIQRFSVHYEYPVYFTRDVFSTNNPILLEAITRKNTDTEHKILVYIDSGVVDSNKDIIKDITAYFDFYSSNLRLLNNPQIVPGGESAKSGWNVVQTIMVDIGNYHMCRHSFVVVIGGGSVLDMVGFATSLVHRGLRLIRIPTTVLAQDDAGVGVKNGMNEHGMKNFVGTFSPPFAVINDFSFLNTLSFKDWVGGVAEAFKVGIIKDREFFYYLVSNARNIYNRDQKVMEEVVKRCAFLHLEHIKTSGDPFEFGTARPLDFGHWSAHKLESMSGYSIGHGQAVAIGIGLDSFYSKEIGLITSEEFQDIIQGLVNCGLPVYHPLLEEKDESGKYRILEGLDEFKEHLGGMLTITLPSGIGNKCEVHSMDTTIIIDGIRFLSRFNRE